MRTLLVAVLAFVSGCSESSPVGPDEPPSGPDRLACAPGSAGTELYLVVSDDRSHCYADGVGVADSTVMRSAYSAGKADWWASDKGHLTMFFGSDLFRALFSVDTATGELTKHQVVTGELLFTTGYSEGTLSVGRIGTDDEAGRTEVVLSDPGLNVRRRFELVTGHEPLSVRDADVSADLSTAVVAYSRFVPDGRGGVSQEDTTRVLVVDLRDGSFRLVGRSYEYIFDVEVSADGSTAVVNDSGQDRLVRLGLDDESERDVVAFSDADVEPGGRSRLFGYGPGSLFITADGPSTLIYSLSDTGEVEGVRSVGAVFRNSYVSEDGAVCLRRYDAAWYPSDGPYRPEVFARYYMASGTLQTFTAPLGRTSYAVSGFVCT